MTDWFAGAVAEHYDENTAVMPIEPVVEFLAPLGDGGALELAIGTGRIALPLAARGVRVAGIDLSPDMVAQLRRKSAAIPVEIGDMTTTHVGGTFSLVYVVFNSINNLTTQDAQVACFENAAARVAPLQPARRALDASLRTVPRRIARRARPDGPPCRLAAARTVERLAAQTLHRREHTARVGLGEARRVTRIQLPFETERLMIRPLRVDDAEDLEQSEDWIREKVDRFERDGGMSLWAVVDRLSSRAVALSPACSGSRSTAAVNSTSAASSPQPHGAAATRQRRHAPSWTLPSQPATSGSRR